MATPPTAADPEFWHDKWEKNSIGWHKGDINKWFMENTDKLTLGKERVKIFFPLCGKSLDMKCLADAGHNVFGVELSSKACQDFFEDLKIPYTCETGPSSNMKTFNSNDGLISLYCCNMFDFNSSIAGQFEAVWDRGAMVALPPELWPQYISLMKTLMADGCQYILERLDYIIPGKTGPPHLVPTEVIQENFGEMYDITVLNRFDSPDDRQKWKAEKFDIEMLLITKK